MTITNLLPQVLPPLKWAGGKRWLVATLYTLWQPFANRQLVEPFAGGLAVSLGLQPESALINDINPHLINFYQQISKGLVINIRLENSEELYYQHRDRFNQLIKENNYKTAEAASIFYYLNKTGYNGLCRFNKKGFYNVPFGRYKKINYTNDFQDYQIVLENWILSNEHFSNLDVTENAFIYADPPYDVEFTNYSSGGFNWDEQEHLAEWLSKHQGPVIASNQATERIQKLYKKLDFKLILVDAPRRISCNGDRSSAKEILALRGIEA